MDSAIIVAIISGIVAISSATLSIWTQRRTDERVNKLEEEREIRAEQRTKDQLAEQVQVRYREPLLLSAFELQSRIWNMVRGGFRLPSGPEHDYLIEHTQYLVAQYLGWIEVMRREIQFLDLGATQKTRNLNKILERITVALSTSWFPPPFRIFRGQQEAIAGEVIQAENPQSPGRQLAVIGFSEFARRLQAGEPAFVRWFRTIASDLEQWAGGDDAGSARLAALQNALMDLVDFFDPQRERFPGNMTRIAPPEGGQYNALPPSMPQADTAAEAESLADEQHFEWEEHPGYVTSQRKVYELAGQAGLTHGTGPYPSLHYGSLWLRDEHGWFRVRNLAGIEWSAQFCADPAKVDLLRQNAHRLYGLLAPEIKQELDHEELLDTPIQDAHGVANWTNSIFNVDVPLPQSPQMTRPPGPDVPKPLEGSELQSAEHGFPASVADIQLFKYDDFHLWVTDESGNAAAVTPLSPRGSGNGQVQVMYATPGSHLAQLKYAAERRGQPLVLGADHPLSKQAYKDQQL